MDFVELLSRADDQTLQVLIGTPAVRLLRQLDPQLASPSRLRSLVLDLESPGELLRDPILRSELLSLLPLDTAREVVHLVTGADVDDPYNEFCSLKIRKGSTLEAEFFDYFGVAPPSESIEEDKPESSSVNAAYSLFDHQRTATRVAGELLRTGNRRALLHMPTGSGKTRTAMNVICDHLRKVEPTLVVWLAYSEELCEQAASEFEVAWDRLGNRSLKVFRFWGARSLDLQNARDGMLIAGLSKAYSAAREKMSWLSNLADRASLVVIDEAHQAIADTYSLLLNGIGVKHESTSLLGLTATPGRTWNSMDQDEELAMFFDRKKVTLEVDGVENAVEFLIQEGYLARPQFKPLTHGGGLHLNDQDHRELSEYLEIPERILEQLAEDEQRNLAIVQCAEQLSRNHDRILVFAATVQHARVLAVVLRARGLDAYSVTGDTPGAERRRLIDRFRTQSDQPAILCNFGVLTTGFDAPRTSAVIIARPTKSLVLYSQMLGRAIRGPRAGGNETAEVVSVVDTFLPGFSDLGEAFLNWEDVWE